MSPSANPALSPSVFFAMLSTATPALSSAVQESAVSVADDV
jgi:hypothetical protein